MTARRDLKRIIRDRQLKTGESYTAARAHVLRDRARISGEPLEAVEARSSERVEAVVLKVNGRSARVRILGEDGSVTLRASGVSELVPGHLIVVVLDKRWTWRDDPYASGRIEAVRVDIRRIGLEPLPLDGGEIVDLREVYEHVRPPDPYAPLWRDLTSEPRACFEMDGVAWGAFPDRPADESPVCEASDLTRAGETDTAREILMDVLCRDLRCLDAHAQLGLLDFDRRPERATLHYAIGVAIGELSLPTGFDGVLPWGSLYNRPLLRCLHGLGLCHWRLGRRDQAIAVFERMLALNPNDNQGVRFCREALKRDESWDDFRDADTAGWN